jgi:hypothetical protein
MYLDIIIQYKTENGKIMYDIYEKPETKHHYHIKRSYIQNGVLLEIIIDGLKRINSLTHSNFIER